MTYTALANLEIALDVFGICCCVFSIFYLIKLKRKSLSDIRISNPDHPENIGPFKESPIVLSGNESFGEALASARKISQAVDLDGRRKHSTDPYDEVRRLLNLGVESDQIAERMNIPQCEIDLIASLRQMQPGAVSDGTGEKNNM
jgi:hypothetical protein